MPFCPNLQEARGPQVSVTLLFTPKEKGKKERKLKKKKIHNFVGWSFSRVFEKLHLPLAFILKLLAVKNNQSSVLSVYNLDIIPYCKSNSPQACQAHYTVSLKSIVRTRHHVGLICPSKFMSCTNIR